MEKKNTLAIREGGGKRGGNLAKRSAESNIAPND